MAKLNDDFLTRDYRRGHDKLGSRNLDSSNASCAKGASYDHNSARR